MNEYPAITVLMSAYNAAPFIVASIEAILDQDFHDFEFIIVNDGSSDETLDILKSYAERDSRIRIIDQANTGLTKALNNGLAQAKGVFIARIDADDIAMPSRLSLQYDLMTKHTDIILCGGDCICTAPQGGEFKWGWINEAELCRVTFFKAPFAHSTAMFRKDSVMTLGGYDESFITAQDMELWMRMMKVGRVVMLDTPLIHMHIRDDSITAKRRWRQSYDAMRARWRHNPPSKRPYAVLLGIRSLLINLLPKRLIMPIKKIRRRLL